MAEGGLKAVDIPGPEKTILHLRLWRLTLPVSSMCGIVFVAEWHADTPSHCNCAQDDASIELMGRLRDANAVRG